MSSSPAAPASQRIEWTDPEALFLAGPGRASNAFWLDAGPGATRGWSWIGSGRPVTGFAPDVTLATAIDSSADAADAIPGGFGGGWVGWSDYDGGARRAGAPASEDPTDPRHAALRVDRLIAFDHSTRTSWLIAPAGDLSAAAGDLAQWQGRVEASDLEPPAEASHIADSRHSSGAYADLIERCRAAIRAGDAYQLCLTTRFSVEASTPIDPVAVYRRLRHTQPSHHGGLIRIGEHALLSASPEQFLHVDEGIVRTRPIKGTRPRSEDPEVDAALAAELAASDKERAENVMIVDLMRNDLQRVCVPGAVAAERLLEIESYPAVHQLVSTVAGRLRPGTTVGELFAAAFPAGSMTGAPKLSAMTILQSLEGGPRGVYAGCFGWIGDDGRADLAMTIRSIVVHPGGAYVGAGGGITWLSDADAEVAEVAVKARGPLAALGASLPDGW